MRDFDDKFVSSVLSAPKSLPSAPCSYGSGHEGVAKMKYCELKPSVHLHDRGLVVSPYFSFLGATPDAQVCCEGVTGNLEVKCPYTARELSVSGTSDKILSDWNLMVTWAGQAARLPPSGSGAVVCHGCSVLRFCCIHQMWNPHWLGDFFQTVILKTKLWKSWPLPTTGMPCLIFRASQCECIET